MQLKVAAIAAANVYLKLLQVPGSGAFKIFHGEVFDRAVGLLRAWGSLGNTLFISTNYCLS